MQVVGTSQYVQRSQKLIQCLVKTELPEQRTDAKMELLTITTQMMPAGVPKFLDVINYPKITDLVKRDGEKHLLKIIFLLVKDFCSSINVVRNMNEDQMIEAANMLLDECGNFRLEDYLMMFAMAKKGKLAKLMDRIDLQVITSIADEYFEQRGEAAQRMESDQHSYYKSIGDTERSNQTDELSEHFNSMADRMSELKQQLKEQREINRANRL